MKNNSLKSLLTPAALALGISGCAHNLTGTAQQNEQLQEKQNSVIEQYFTPQITPQLREIPIHYAEIDNDWAQAASSFSMLDAMWHGWGYEPIIIYSINKANTVKEYLLAHELIHFADKNLENIDNQEFTRAWNETSQNPESAQLTQLINTHISIRYGNIDEETLLAERIAYTAQHIIYRTLRDFWGNTIEIPEHLRAVYRNALNENVLNLNHRPK